RYLHFSGDPSKGLIIIPCELIDRNGDNLKKIVYQLALEWNLEQEFINWLDSSNFFLNSLVDRIVTGYPKDDIENLTNELQYKDNLINTCEVFNLWVIEGDSKLSNELPLANTGCNVIWTNDMTPYRTRKVRILNGVHTMMCMTSYLYGLDTVGNSLKDPIISKYIKKGLYDEIIPSVNFNEDELKSFASDVLERFANPFIEHQLMSITLNSVSKYKARVLPTMLEYVSKFNSAPKTLSCGLASLIHFYKGINEKGEIITVSDDKDILIKFRDLWDKFDANLLDSQSLVSSILSDISFWGEDLTKNRILTNGILFYFNSIQDKGIGQTLKELV
ncbi:MAG: tagaturonate reductase, partial [Spirochaetales bacterium]|nr:tagaturonate reductase [Spirochaetales bacterium]